MKTKVTFTAEKSVVKRAKEYAESTGSSLSNLVENYLKSFQEGQSNIKMMNYLL